MIRRRFYLLFSFLLVLAGAFWGWQAWAARPVYLSTLNADQWRADLHVLVRELVRRHANAFHHVGRQDFDQLVTKVDNLIPGSAPADMPVQFLRLTAAIGDGHTTVQLPRSGLRYPIRLYWFGDQLRVIRATTAVQAALGSRLTAIGGMPLEKITTHLHEIISQDENRWNFIDVSARWIIRPEVLHALGIVTDTKAARFTFAKDDGGTLELTLSPAAEQQPDWKEAYPSAPLYLQHQSDNFCFTSFPEAKVVYVVFNHYDWLFFHSWKLFRYLDARPGWKLVIDMRQNGGGDYHVGHWCLIRRISARPSLDTRGNLFVITGRATFSAAMSNAAQFRSETNATLVGEPPGEVPNSYQESRSFRLPNSHLIVNYSVRYYKFLPTDSKALMPDREIPPDWESYRKGVDPVLQYLVSTSSNP